MSYYLFIFIFYCHKKYLTRIFPFISFFLSLCAIYFFLLFYFPFPTPPFSSPLTPPLFSPLTAQEGQRKAAYNCDVTYVSNQELGFDFLRDNLALYVTQPYSTLYYTIFYCSHFYSIINLFVSPFIIFSHFILLISIFFFFFFIVFPTHTIV